MSKENSKKSKKQKSERDNIMNIKIGNEIIEPVKLERKNTYQGLGVGVRLA